METFNTVSTAGAGICYALLEERNQYFSSPKAGLLFFLYLMSPQCTTPLALPIGFVLPTSLVPVHFSLIAFSESLRVREPPLSTRTLYEAAR